MSEEDRVFPRTSGRAFEGVGSPDVCNPYAPLIILATRSTALRFCRGTMVGACKLAGRDLGGVAMAPPTSDIRESERRGEFTSPCADAGREETKLEVDRESDGPIGGLTAKWSVGVLTLEEGKGTYTDTKRAARPPLTRAVARCGSA